MQGKILDFSVQSSTGVISGQDNKRYQFSGSEWKEQQLPRRGMAVDFDVDAQGNAIAVYSALAGSTVNSATDVISQFKEKSEDQYSPFDWFLKCLKHYATFAGRARRKEFWFFLLFCAIGGGVAIVVDSTLQADMIIYLLYAFAMLIPAISVSVRRLHDIGKSGWWYWISAIPFIGVVLSIIWYAKEGDAEANQYGQPTK